jgi:hypothetical protein
LEEWRSGGVEEWRSGGVEEWRSGGVEEWRSGGVEMEGGQEEKEGLDGVVDVPSGSPRGDKRPPEPFFSSLGSSSLVVGMCSCSSLFDMVILICVCECWG